jgi:hypothetical protein
VIIECDEEWLILASKILENAQSFLAFVFLERIRIKELSVWLFQRPQKLTIFLGGRVKNRQFFDLIFLIFQNLQTVLIYIKTGSFEFFLRTMVMNIMHKGPMHKGILEMRA